MKYSIPAIVLSCVAVTSHAMNLRHGDDEQNKHQLIQHRQAETNYDKSNTIKRSLLFNDDEVHKLEQILHFGSISNVKKPIEKDFGETIALQFSQDNKTDKKKQKQQERMKEKESRKKLRQEQRKQQREQRRKQTA
mmetsp:Transcript_6534/g.9681  ORF Transcript_6534/g.9681 Transcript_6534/m.9681 type:complete len:136 (+) Transcript_6534:109-516(+)